MHVPPPEPNVPRPRRPFIPPPPPQKHYKIIFIKAPTPPPPEIPEINIPPPPETKTLVYVLGKDIIKNACIFLILNLNTSLNLNSQEA